MWSMKAIARPWSASQNLIFHEGRSGPRQHEACSGLSVSQAQRQTSCLEVQRLQEVQRMDVAGP